VLGAEAAKLALDLVDLPLEHVDQVEARLDGRPPRLGQLQALEEAPSAGPEEVADRRAQAVLEEDRMDAVLERGALVDEMDAEARPLALGPHLRIGQPDLGHKVAAGKLGQDPGVDPIGLAGKRRHPFARCASAIRTSHPARSSWSWTKREPVRLDHRQHGLAPLAIEAADEVREPVAIRRTGIGTDRLAVDEQGVPVETLAAEIQSDVQHRGASFR
jgi:hypothetical protein